MSAGQAKIELLLELRNRIKAGLSSARDTLNKSVSSMKQKLGEIKASSIEAFTAAKEQIPGLGNALELLANPYALVTAAVLALGAAYIKAGQMSAEWQKSLAKVNVTAQLSKTELKGLSTQLLDIGRDSTGDLMEVPETFNKIISAGFDVKTSLDTLKPTLLAAKAGFTDAGVAADAATNLMGSSGIMDATRIYDILFATMNKGKAEFADIANYLPKIIPGARMAGVSLEQTAGMFAFLTASGLKAEAASTALANAMKSLSDPDIVYGTKTKGGFKSLGVDIFDAHGKMRDMVTIAGMLNKAMDGLTDEQRINKFAKIGLDMESSMAFAKMSQGIEQLKQDIDFTTNSQGQLNEAVKNAKEPLDSWKVINNEIKASMIEIGEGGVGALGMLGDKVLEGINYFKELYQNSEFFRDVLAAVGVAAEISFKLLTMGARALWGVLKFLWEGVERLRDSIFGSSDGFEQWYMKIKPYILWVWQYLSGVAKMMFSVSTFDFDGFKEAANQLANGKSIDVIRKEVIQERIDRKTKEQTEPPALVPPTAGKNGKGGVPGSPKTGGNSDTSKVTGSQQQIRNITFNMDAMVKMGDFVSKNAEVANMSKKELEQWFHEMCARTIMNIETSYGSGN